MNGPVNPAAKPPKLRMRLPALATLPAVPSAPPGTTLRLAGPDDAPGLAAVLAGAFADARWTADLVRKVLLDAPDVVEVWLVLGDDGAALATASSRLMPERFPGSGYLHWVGVHPNASRRGLGRLVSLAALDEARRRGCPDAVLETDDHRRAAIRLYAGLGFVAEMYTEGQAERWAAIGTLGGLRA